MGEVAELISCGEDLLDLVTFLSLVLVSAVAARRTLHYDLIQMLKQAEIRSIRPM